MKIHTEFQQRSAEWLYFKAGIPSASEFHNLVTPKKLEVRSGEMFNSYVTRKLAEKWSGPLMGFNSFATDQGNLLEEEAIPWFEFEFEEKVQSVGFVTDDLGRVGCSPDGLLKLGGVEFKCPAADTHVKYLLGGKVPDDYILQVQGAMLVCNAEVWKFVSYRRKYPPLVLNVQRDGAIQEALTEALAIFRDKFDAGWARLCEMNGGPPAPVAVPEQMVFADDIQHGKAEDPENFDNIP